jgi:hypothetical protein
MQVIGYLLPGRKSNQMYDFTLTAYLTGHCFIKCRDIVALTRLDVKRLQIFVVV